MVEKQSVATWQRGMHGIMSLRPVTWLAVRSMHHLDRLAYRLSNGRFTAVGLLGGLPVITLTTTGAKSGLERSVPLVGIPDGDKIILIASNWGQERHPSWFYNLCANPQVKVTFKGEEYLYNARETEGAEKKASWEKAVGMYGGYEAYKARTGGREIPVIVLTPTGKPV